MSRSSASTSNIMLAAEKPVTLKKPIVVTFPKRTPSIVIPEREIVYVTPDKTTCAECECFPKESPYRKPPKLVQCLMSPATLYELAADAVDYLWLPGALDWSEEKVAEWMGEKVGLPQYKACMLDNHIDGKRLLMLEDPSKLPKLNIHDFEHIKTIVAHIRKLYSTDFIKFCRSIGLPERFPLTHCTWFKSRTGPSWGIRRNWTRSDILRWMKILGPSPPYLDHWDLVWYEKPDFPKTLFAKIPKAEKREELPYFRPAIEHCNEYLTPRKYKTSHPEDDQMIWMEHLPGSPSRKKSVEYLDERKKRVKKEVKVSRLIRPKITLEGLRGKELLLARRLMPKQKFLI